MKNSERHWIEKLGGGKEDSCNIFSAIKVWVK